MQYHRVPLIKPYLLLRARLFLTAAWPFAMVTMLRHTAKGKLFLNPVVRQPLCMHPICMNGMRRLPYAHQTIFADVPTRWYAAWGMHASLHHGLHLVCYIEALLGRWGVMRVGRALAYAFRVLHGAEKHIIDLK
jgi:hypothetical protein